MNLTEQGTYKEFLRQLLIFLEDNKNFNNYRESINEFKEELITSNNYRIGDLYTTKWCEREIKVCKYKIQAGAKPNLLYGDPKIIMKKLKEKLKELKETDYEEENNKQLQKYSDLIITKMDKYMCKNISNYEIAKDRFVAGEIEPDNPNPMDIDCVTVKDAEE